MLGLTAGLIAWPVSATALSQPGMSQAALDTLAHNIGYRMAILDNHAGAVQPGKMFAGEITLTLPKTYADETGWSLYVSLVEAVTSSSSDAFSLTHINGDLYRITPKDGIPLKAGTIYKILYSGPGHLFSEYYTIPNAYIAADGLKARTLDAARAHYDAETGMETLPFAVPMIDEAKLGTQDPKDNSRWLTPERAFLQNAKREARVSPPDFIILPTPVVAKHLTGKALDLSYGVQLTLNGLVESDIAAALAQAHLKTEKSGVAVKITIDPTYGIAEAYHLKAQDGQITIIAADASGAAYAIDSLGQQAAFEHNHLKPLEITDAPRFGFRGLLLDVARNFQTKAHILAVIDQMGLYKLNRLHLHLGDDEGWRVAIAGLPELTDIGAKRCHDLSEDTCLLPQLGAGPDGTSSVNGYLTRADYIEILKAAKARHIEVIPSFDMPGHSRAAIRSMEARYRHLMAAGKPDEANEFRLIDPKDTTVYDSVQHYHDNTLNICLPSTYRFIDKVMDSLVELHKEAGVPLKRYHIGADETTGAWTDSPACQDMMAKNHLTPAEMTPYFIEKVSDALAEKGIEPAGWSDGMGHVDPTRMPKVVQSNSWVGLFDGGAADAHKIANQGWDAILSTPDVLYFDMPNTLDPKERGYDWATRTNSLYKVFAFMPQNLPANASVMPDNLAHGASIKDSEPLEAGRQIAGMQGQLWGETIRSDQIADYMLYPRTFALAERAWHKASWEPDYKPGLSYSYDDGQVDTTRLLADWQGFNLKLKLPLQRLDALGTPYRLPVPGARITGGVLEANIAYGNLKIVYRVKGRKWRVYHGPISVVGPVEVRSVSPDARRFSRSAFVN